MANPVSPVIEGMERHEIQYAKDQSEYSKLPAIKTQEGIVITRWRLSAEEIARIIAGKDIYLQIHTFNKPLQPVRIDVVDDFIEYMELKEIPAPTNVVNNG